jgi:hypothetical protein
MPRTTSWGSFRLPKSRFKRICGDGLGLHWPVDCDKHNHNLRRVPNQAPLVRFPVPCAGLPLLWREPSPADLQPSEPVARLG